MTETYAHSVVARLCDHGIDTVFAIPGTHNLEIFRAMQDLGVRIIPAHHEQGLGYAADAYARVTGRPAVVVTTTGPGITNLITALATSAAASVPIIAIAPGLPDRVLGSHSGWLHELPDQLGMMGSLLHAHRATSRIDARDFIDQCMSSWEAGRTAPAYLELPLDALAEPGAVIRHRTSGGDNGDHEEQRDVRDLRTEAVAKALNEATRPVIIAGRGACSASASSAVRCIAETLGAVVLTTANAKGVLDERHPLALGVSLRTVAAKALIADADVILVVGSDLGPSEFWGPPSFVGAVVARIDVDSKKLSANVEPDIALLGNAEMLAPELASVLSEVRGSASVQSKPDAELPAWATFHARAIERELREGGEVYREFHSIMQEELGDLDVAVTGDSSQASYLGTATFWVSSRPHRFLYPAGFGTLGYAVPAAIGAALTGAVERVVAVTGEGGLLFSVQELATVAELGLKCITVVFVNGGFREIRDGMENLGVTPVGVDFTSPDFVTLAAAFGISAESVAADRGEEQAFRAAFRRACDSDGPTLIEVHLD